MKARQGIRFLRPAVVVFSSVVTFALGSNNSTIIDTFLGYKSEVVFINSTSTPDVADISSHQNISEELTCPKGYFATAGVGIFRRADDTLVGSGFICRNPDGGAKRKLVSKLPAEDEYEKVARCATPKNSSTELAVEDYLTGAVVEISNFSGQQQLQTWMPTCNFGLGPSPSYQANSSDSYQASQAQVCSENTYVSALVLRKRNGEIEGMSIKCTDATSQLFSSIAAKHSSTPDSYLARLQDVGSGPEYMNCPSQSFLSGFKVWRSSEQVSGMQLRCTDESTGMSNFLQASGETHGIASEIFCWSGQKVISILAELHRFHVIRSFAVSCTDGRTLKMPEFSRKSMRSAYTKCAKSTYVAGVIASIGQDGYVDMQLHCAKTSRGASDMMGVLNENYEGPQTVLFDSSPLQLELADLSILDLPPETADNEVYTDQVENLPCPKDFYASAVICTFKGVEKDILSLGIVCLHPYSKEKRTILSKSGKNEDMFDISTRCAVLDSAHSVTDHFLKGFSTSINMNSGLSRLEMISCICDHGKQSVPLGSQQNSPLSKMDSCPEGQYIQQISVGKTPTAMLVTGLNFTCATPTDLLRSSMQVQVPDNYLVHSRPKEIVAEIYTENELLCPVGSFGTGSNTWLGPGGANAIQLICSEKESGKKKYSKIAGSPIGRVDQSNCNSAGYLQGLLGVYSPDLIGFACTCSGGATTLTFGSTTSSQVPDAMLCAEERYFSGLVVKFGATGIVDLLGRCSKEAGSIASVSFGEDSNFAQFYNPPQPYDDNYVPDSCTITDYECQTRVAAGFAVRFGFVGLVSVQTALANSGETPQCYFPQPSPPDLGRISTSIATGQDIDSIPEVVLSEQEKMKHLKEYCGTMQISSSNNGCIWKVRDLLRVLWKEGVYLLSVGVPVEAAFSLYVHGTHLAWNRANCSPEGNLTYIPIPVGYEGLYGIASAEIMAKMKINSANFYNVSMANLNNLQRPAISGRMVIDEDSADELSAESFDISKNITIVTDTIRDTTVSDKSDESNVALWSKNLSPRFKFNGKLTKLFNDTISSTARISYPVAKEILLPQKNRFYSHANYTFSKLSQKDCGDLYFKFRFSPVTNISLFENKYQHCCSNTCYSYIFFGNYYGGTSALNECCCLCNKYSCHELTQAQLSTQVFISQSTIIESPAKDLLASAIYFLSI